MAKLTLMFTKKECMGCHSCEVACKQEHGLGVGPRLVRVVEQAPDFYPIYCHHCPDAPCKKACPVDAISKDDSGIVVIDDQLCIGCKDCLEACPFGAMQYDADQDVAVKCDLCVQRLKENQPPACSAVCPTGCILWGESRSVAKRIAAAAAGETTP